MGVRGGAESVARRRMISCCCQVVTHKVAERGSDERIKLVQRLLGVAEDGSIVESRIILEDGVTVEQPPEVGSHGPTVDLLNPRRRDEDVAVPKVPRGAEDDSCLQRRTFPVLGNQLGHLVGAKGETCTV